MGCGVSKPRRASPTFSTDELAVLGAARAASGAPLRAVPARDLGPPVATYLLRVRSPTDPGAVECYRLHVHKRSRLRAAAEARRERKRGVA